MNKYFIFILVLWIISPISAILAIFIYINQVKLREQDIIKCFFLISSSMALLAFTQKSISAGIDTDIQRYYDEFSYLENSSFDILPLLFSESILTYSFTCINCILVILTKNVQIISLFWIFIIYYFHYLTFVEIMKHEQIPLSKTNIFLLATFSIFGAILFTQVTETIKTAAAFSLFFYVLTKYIYGWNLYKILASMFIIIGIHSMTLMLTPLFFYKKFNTDLLIILFLIIVILSPFINLMSLAMKVIPDIGFMSLLVAKAEDYSNFAGEDTTKRYIIISLFLFFYLMILYKKGVLKANKYQNIVLVYLIITWLNYNNSHAFIRFINFATFMIMFEFIFLLRYYKVKSYIIIFFISFFLLTNFQMTKGRTTKGNYASSYMDNSLSKIFLSSIYDYWSYDAYHTTK